MYKSRSWRLTFMTALFVPNVFKGVTSGLKQAHKNEDQPWLWPGDETSLKTKFSYMQNVTPKPVEIYSEKQKPEFKKSGRRISEIKCLEYIWERKNRANFQREDTCPQFPDHEVFCEIGGREALHAEFPHMDISKAVEREKKEEKRVEEYESIKFYNCINTVIELGALGWRSVENSWIFKCGCSLISPKFTVTAAHCSKIRKGPIIAKRKPEIVRLGQKNIIDVYANGDLIDAFILRIIVHPQYSSPKKYYDIALVELTSEIQFSSKVQPACLWNKFDTTRLGSEASSTGWGVVDTVTRLTSPTLQATVMDIIDSEQCSRLLRRFCNRRWCGLRDHQLCAGKLAGGVDACQGDSGGPLQVKINLPSSEKGSMHYLIGVTSFGIGCARPNKPGVYTRVSSFVDWIESIVWPEQSEAYIE